MENTLDCCVLALKGLHILAQGIALGKKNEVLFEPRKSINRSLELLLARKKTS
jgi:hypothetical protein